MRCTKCLSDTENFPKDPRKLSGLSSHCRPCRAADTAKRRRTKEGFLSALYARQRASSKRRGHPMPGYSNQELRTWALSQPLFHELFKNRTSRNSSPSVDRIDDYKPYTLNNIQLMTWAENNKKAAKDTRGGVLNKRSKAVTKLTLEGTELESYHSASHAARMNSLDMSSICRCSRGKSNQVGGFKWSYNEDQ